MKNFLCLFSLATSLIITLGAFMIFVPLTKNVVPEYFLLLILGLTLIIVARYHRGKKICKLG
jgi:predicted membrane metal-binding protein